MESLTPTAAEESAADFSLPGLWCGERSSCWAGVNVSLQQKTARTCSVSSALSSLQFVVAVYEESPGGAIGLKAITCEGPINTRGRVTEAEASSRSPNI